MYASVETPIRVMDDASGAPMVLSVGRYRFAADFLGEVKLNLIAPVSGSRRESKMAANIARAEYRRQLLANTSNAWRGRNAAMYDTLVSVPAGQADTDDDGLPLGYA